MADATRLDTISLRCLVAGQLGATLAAKRGADSADQFVEAYLEVLDELRDQSIYPPRDE